MIMLFKTLFLCAAWLTIVQCQHQGPTTTPVPILKQINRQNDDGSYSYGYEAADGSFKIETKYPNGDVAGKYGYVDESGKTREISYGASSQRGFEPQGSGINVPPPTLNEPSNTITDGQEDDGQYREDPKIYEDPKYNGRAQSRPASNFRQFHQPAQPEYQQEYQPTQYRQTAPAFQQEYQPTQYRQPAPAFEPASPVPRSQPTQFRSQFNQQSNLFSQSPQQFPQERPQSQVYHQQPQFSYQAYTPQPYSQYQTQTPQPAPYQQSYQPQSYQGQNYNPFSGHPAQNFDPNTGSYSINFTGK